MEYLLDANIFIEAKRRYYGMDICPGFWDWLDSAHYAGKIASISMVGQELANGNDELSKWSKKRIGSSWFMDISDRETQGRFKEILQAVERGGYREYAKEQFFSGADPWLIAKAMTIGATVVTHETYNPDSKRKVPIPNVCREFGVLYLDTFDLLRQHLASFSLAETE